MYEVMEFFYWWTLREFLAGGPLAETGVDGDEHMGSSTLCTDGHHQSTFVSFCLWMKSHKRDQVLGLFIAGAGNESQLSH